MKQLAVLIAATLALTACDAGEAETKTKIRNVNPGAVIAVSGATAAPASAVGGDTVLFSLEVAAQNPLQAVTINLSTLGGANGIAMYDDGTNGDLAAADGKYSLSYLLPTTGLSAGAYFLPFLVEDVDSFTYPGTIALSILNSSPEIVVATSTVSNADGTSGNAFGPTETMQFRIDVQDADHPPASLTVTADLSGAFGGGAAEVLTYNATSGLWELDYVGPRGMIPTTGTGSVHITAVDSLGATGTRLFDVEAQNWVGLAGSDLGDGISTSAGWTLGSFCTTDSAGRVYVAYSSRVDYAGGWQYAVYVKRYDPTTNTWSGLAGSDSGFGLCLNTQGRLISSGYVRDIACYTETNQAQNKEAVYIVFDGDPDPDDVSGEAHWDSFLYRWNITDNQWEALGTGTNASDWITATPTVGVMDVGGFTRFGNRAQEASLSFDPATDDVYVSWHGQIDSSGSNRYAVFVSRFNRVAGAWQDFSGATPADGISDDHFENYRFPKIRHHGGKLYLIYHSMTSGGDILIHEGDLTTGNWSAATTIYDSTGLPAGGYPDLWISASGQMYAGWKITQSGPTDQEVHVLRATTSVWSAPANWTAPDGISSKISIPGNTSTSVIYTRLVGDTSGNVYACWNQVHPGSTSASSRNVFMAKFNGTAWVSMRGSLSDDGVSNYGTETHWLPALAIDPQGRPVVCYDTFWGTGSGNDRRKIYVKVLR